MKAINVNKIDFKAKKKLIENFNKNSSVRNKTSCTQSAFNKHRLKQINTLTELKGEIKNLYH